MPEEKPEEKPRGKVAESGGLGQVLLDLADKASGKVGDSKGSSLPVYIIFTSLVVVCFAVLGFLAIRARRKVAQLEYELRRQEEEKKRLGEQAELEVDDAKRAVSMRLIHESIERVVELKKELVAHEAASVGRAHDLAKAAGWGDLVVIDKRN